MANNLDRLFRENLDQLEITPSEQGWNQVRNQIAKKKSPWIIPMRIAAAVVLVMVATLVIINTGENKHQQFISSVDHPSQMPSVSWEIDMPRQHPLPTQKAEKMGPVADHKNTKAANTVQNDEFVFKSTATLSIAGINQTLVDSDFSTRNLKLIDDQHEPDLPSIKITYIASEQPVAVDSARTGKISKVFAFAKDVSTSDLLADLRDAKDNLFKRN